MQQSFGLAIRGDTRAVRGILLDLDGVVLAEFSHTLSVRQTS
jgi:hypothetical protein